MKAIGIILAIVTGMTLASLYVVQSHQLARERKQAAAVQAELQQKSDEVEGLQARQAQLQKQRRELAEANDNLAAQVQTQAAAMSTTTAAVAVPATLTNLGAGDVEKGGMGKLLGKMMQDPDTRKFIRDQQRVVMDQLYAPLVKQLGLTPEEATQFKDLIADNAMKGADKASSLFGGSTEDRAQALKAVEADQKQAEEQIKTLLGDDRYRLYQAYQETAGERMLLNNYKQQNPSDYQITDAQTEQLLTIMQQEKKAAADSGQLFPSASSGMTDADKLQAMLSDGQSEKLLDGQQAVNQRVFDRARMILSPDQLQSFGAFQTNQINMMRMSFSMAKKLFAPDNAVQPAQPPGQ